MTLPLPKGTCTGRLCRRLRGKDKWWQIKEDSEQWRATSYLDQNEVLSTAVEDVTRDVRAVLAKLGADAGGTAGA